MKLTPTLGGAYSGSIGGLTASHNKGGQYLRRRSVPTNPNTLRQQLVRSILGGLVNTWSDDLTDAERQAWRDYAQNTPVTDSLGQSMTLSGLNMFVRSNSALAQVVANPGLGVSLPVLEAAPVVFNTGEPVLAVTEFSAVFTTPPGTITFGGDLAGPAPVGGSVVLFVAPPQTPGTRYYKGPYQLAAVVGGLTATDTDFTASIDLSDDPPAWVSDSVPIAAWDGLNVPVRLVVLYVDGRVSQQFRAIVPFVDATP